MVSCGMTEAFGRLSLAASAPGGAAPVVAVSSTAVAFAVAHGIGVTDTETGETKVRT
jgi:hypothetical protein